MALALLAIGLFPASAELFDTIGVTVLRTMTTNLNGAGIHVAQVESPLDFTSPRPFEVNPNHTTITQPVSLFTYHSTLGSATTYPNSVGAESYHANIVGASFFGLPAGVAPNVVHVDNYEVNDFVNSFVFSGSKPAIPATIVNQSYIFGDITTSQQITYDQEFDDYAAKHSVLFVSGVGNRDTNQYQGAVNVPASCYNGIGVAAYGTFYSSVGPTLDNGRSKPDITSPSVLPLATSYSTPLVAGSAAVLMQAGARGDGGADTSAATDMRTLKALLLNGAVKPLDWTHSTTAPLDARHGAGILNVFNSYMQLAGGKHAAIEQTSVSPGAAHPPGGSTATLVSNSGWDSATLSSSVGSDRINHYYFNLTNQVGQAPFTATVTLVWNRQAGHSDINDLNVFLYDVQSGSLMAESVSTVDNVEHLYVENLPSGRYDLQVLKRGGAGSQHVTASEDYALTWEFFNVSLGIALTNSMAVLTWPVYPAGFVLESSPSIHSSASWSVVGATPTITGQMNRLELSLGGNTTFFRLRRP